jgi:hypothetical protein
VVGGGVGGEAATAEGGGEEALHPLFLRMQVDTPAALPRPSTLPANTNQKSSDVRVRNFDQSLCPADRRGLAAAAMQLASHVRLVWELHNRGLWPTRELQ